MLVFTLCLCSTACMLHVFRDDATFRKPFPQMQLSNAWNKALKSPETLPLFSGKYSCTDKTFYVFRRILLLLWKRRSSSRRKPSKSLKKSSNLWSIQLETLSPVHSVNHSIFVYGLTQRLYELVQCCWHTSLSGITHDAFHGQKITLL